ncbi:hypothetical protein BCR36DRAFT_399946 [Piromyces finnis]|uniref:Chromosome segregation in meiosis protein n=1 Tax=Piromyces finnis TaxID=1754191 RepID=A0A1Y1V0S7_9FUNG|nr:hypothetical protein BCR36DRAFT_399946 [Piromyces finnis]|eukprot:ORX43514.1 hypothetical protein BCR36DRAFT_399946 [Piromyces finnis]
MVMIMKENLNRLINVYQIWGHNLYPRLKFKSIVERVEKLCTEKSLRIAYSTWKEANKYRKKYETDEYNTSGIIRADEDPLAEVGGNFNMDIDIFKPFPSGSNTTTTTTTIPNTQTNSGLSSTPPSVSLSRLDHPLTEEERNFMRINRERALQKLRQKKEELRRQRELEQQQQQQQEQEEQSILELASTSAI